LPLFLFIIASAATKSIILSLHDALPIFKALNNQSSEVKIDLPLLVVGGSAGLSLSFKTLVVLLGKFFFRGENDLVVDTESMKWRSEEHTSELQSRENLVCRLLLEKKNK